MEPSEKLPNMMEKIRDSGRGHSMALTSAAGPVASAKSTDSGSLARLPERLVALPEETLRTAARLRMALTPGEQSLAFTGLTAADMASDVALGVALAFSQVAPGGVVLVSAASPPPAGSGPGLAEVLSDECSVHAALGEAGPEGLFILPAGRLPANPLALFSTPEFASLFVALKEKFQYVLVDAGPLLSPASTMLIAGCDAVAVALAAGRHRRGEVVEIQNELARVRTRMLGVVLTGEKR
jgi:hypothetical protein